MQLADALEQAERINEGVERERLALIVECNRLTDENLHLRHVARMQEIVDRAECEREGVIREEMFRLYRELDDVRAQRDRASEVNK